MSRLAEVLAPFLPLDMSEDYGDYVIPRHDMREAERVAAAVRAHLVALAQDERVRERWRNAAGVSYYADAAVAAFLAAVEEGL